MLILGIETSCDETAAAVAEMRHNKIKILSSVISSQIDIHRQYGGVVPEVAAREHVLNILPVIDRALSGAGIKRKDAPEKLTAIAVSNGPGLITSLGVGTETAKTLAFVWNLPLAAINHIEGHIYANFIFTNSNHIPKIKFPAIILTVSGGHTMLVLMKNHGQIETIGDTRDDAAGEAFDKAAQLLNIGYPGGPAVAAEATKFSHLQKSNNSSKINLPRPMIGSSDFNFSFSGLKTALLYQLKKDPLRLREGEAGKNWKNRISEYAYEYQQAIIDTLIHKTKKAAEKYQVKTVMLAGGVAANIELRRQLEEMVAQKLPRAAFVMPDMKYTTDNAAMIAAAGCFKAKKKKFTDWRKLRVDSNLEL